MKQEEWKGLDRGDIVRHVDGTESYVVEGNYGSEVMLLVRAILANNPPEWIKVKK